MKHLLQQCLEALEFTKVHLNGEFHRPVDSAITAIKEALAKNEPSPFQKLTESEIWETLRTNKHGNALLNISRTDVDGSIAQLTYKGLYRALEDVLFEKNKVMSAMRAIKEDLTKDEQAPVAKGELFMRVLKSKSTNPQYQPDEYEEIPVQRQPLSEEELWKLFQKDKEEYDKLVKAKNKWCAFKLSSTSIENAVYEKMGIK